MSPTQTRKDGKLASSNHTNVSTVSTNTYAPIVAILDIPSRIVQNPATSKAKSDQDQSASSPNLDLGKD